MVISPYSAVDAILLLLQANNGNALHQFKSSINFTGSKTDLLDAYGVYQQSFTESLRKSTMILEYELFVQQVHMNLSFEATHRLGPGVEIINFINSTETANIITNLDAEKANNKTDTEVILMNDIYMKFTFDKVYQSFAVDTSDKFYVHDPKSVVHYNDFEYVTLDNGW